MLYTHSEYFTKIFNMVDPYLYREQQTKEITLRNVDYISFYQILFYCYNGYFPEQNSYNMYDWIALLITSSRFLFQNIFNYCELQLKKYINMETIEEINEYAIINSAVQLRRYCYLYKKYYGLEEDDDDLDNYVDDDLFDSDDNKNENKINMETEDAYSNNDIQSKDTLCIDERQDKDHLGLNKHVQNSLLQLKQLSNKSINVLFHNKFAQSLSYKISFWLNRMLFVINRDNIQVLSLTCQCILWPIIDSVKSFKIISNIIKGYCNGMKNEYKQIDKNEKHLPFTCLSEVHEKDNNYQTSDSYIIIKSSQLMDEDIRNLKMTTYEMNSIDPTSTSTTLAHNSDAHCSTVNVDTSKIAIPDIVKVNQHEKYNTMIPNIHNSKYHIIDMDFNTNIGTNECTYKKSSSRSKFINKIRTAGNEIEINIDNAISSSSSSSSSSSPSTSSSSLHIFKNNHENQSFTLDIQDSENNRKVTIPLNYFENKSFIDNIFSIWSYRIKSSIILCGRWWRIIITHPLGIYFIVFPGITKQIYLNGYEGYRFFWWHRKTFI
ncbi:hypothetical protein PIROE2DRAFT_20129 [Piromyces sp. E2]|nr:hypothetical protein PIROE2DRAFT_20129 [Piromyces sp. E2]|eukprot:OUM66757.1 hypothetical protein PIROE2DRAFT_20129 [Piromyces sp. E2]